MRSARLRRHGSFEAKIEFLDEGINDPDGVVLGDPVVEMLGDKVCKTIGNFSGRCAHRQCRGAARSSTAESLSLPTRCWITWRKIYP